MPNQSAMAIDEILRDCRTIAVVGLSSNPARPSHRVAAYMQSQGYRVIPVNPNETTVLGEPAYPSLPSLCIPHPCPGLSIATRERSRSGDARRAEGA